MLAVVGLKREARLLAGLGVRTVIGGGDADGLKAKLRQVLVDGPIKAVVSVGLGGALSPAVQVGDWVVGESVIAESERWNTDDGWSAILRARLMEISTVDRLPRGSKDSVLRAAWRPSLGPRFRGDDGVAKRRVRLGPVVGSGVMIEDAEAKAALHNATGALAVDMESHIAARFASAHGLPFVVLRVISDGADRDLPKAALAAMRTDGGMDVAAVLRALVHDPHQLRALIRTGQEAEVAFQALALLGRHNLLGRPRVGELDLGELLIDVT